MWYDILRTLDINERKDNYLKLLLCTKDIRHCILNMKYELDFLEDQNRVLLQRFENVLRNQNIKVNIHPLGSTRSMTYDCENHSVYKDVPNYWNISKDDNLYSLSNILKLMNKGLLIEKYSIHGSFHLESIIPNSNINNNKTRIRRIDFEICSPDVRNCILIMTFSEYEYEYESMSIGKKLIDIVREISFTYDDGKFIWHNSVDESDFIHIIPEKDKYAFMFDMSNNRYVVQYKNEKCLACYYGLGMSFINEYKNIGFSKALIESLCV